MLTSLTVRHFQALHDVALELSPFTVIVGASSSGKSALTRALHTLTHNRRGTEWITHGEQAASITARTTTHSVTLTRTVKPGDGNAYTVTPLDSTGTPSGPTSTTERFTKLGSAVPEAVSAALGISPEGINFAGQHDLPFMLAESSTANATALGRLTNVHTIFEAAREANRQRNGHTSTLRTRAADLESITSSLDRFKNLTAQRVAIEQADEAAKQAHQTSAALDRLRFLIETLRITSSATRTLSAAATRTVPSTAAAEETSASLTRLHTLRGRLIGHVQETKSAQQAQEQATRDAGMLTDARAGLMANLSDDIERFMHPHATTHESITVYAAARVSAEYIRDVL